MKEKYESIFIELGPLFIERVCGITVEKVLDFIYHDKELLESEIAKLDFLTEIVNCLEGAYKRWDGSIKKWFHRKRKALGNLSPYQRMKWPDFWSPQSASRKEILVLAKSVRDGNRT